MAGLLSHSQIEDLLRYCGSDKLQMWKNDKIQFCCPIHGESNPSCGINADYSPPEKPGEHYQVFHCFSCGESGTIPWFVFKSLPDQFKSVKAVNTFLKERYGVTYTYHYDPETQTIKRYEDFFEDTAEPRFELPLSKLAPFKSGKETYQYFFDRGFDKSDMRDYMIGRDLESETVTVPVFWEDKKLAGIIGRYIDPSRPKNMRFKVYNFPKGSLIYPLDKLEVSDNTVILVEALFDVMMLRKWGFFNVAAIMGDGFSKSQADLVANRCNKVITLFDNDAGGDIARSLVEKHLSKKGVAVYHPTVYPDSGKDPIEWGERVTVEVLKSSRYFIGKSLPRL